MQTFTNKTIITLVAGFFVSIVSVIGLVNWKNMQTKSEFSDTQNIQTVVRPAQANAIKQDFSTIYYADIQADRNDEYGVPTNITFYNYNIRTKERKEIFALPANKLDISDFSPNFQFCPISNKIYLRRVWTDDERIAEIDLQGTVKDLDFTSTHSSLYKDWSHLGNYFVLSNDCKKIIWSTYYYEVVDRNPTNGVNEIVLSNVDGTGREILQGVTRSIPDRTGNKVLKWFANNLYLTNDGWGYLYARPGGLYKLDITNRSVSKINTIPSQNIIWDVSPNGDLIAHQEKTLNGTSNSFITNILDDSKMILQDKSDGQMKFSPDDRYLAHIVNDPEKPILYVADFNSKTDKIFSRNAIVLDWLSKDTVIALRNGKDLLTINIKDGKENSIASTTSHLILVGLSK